MLTQFAGIVVALSASSTVAHTLEPRLPQDSTKFEDVTDQAGVAFTHVRGGVGEKYMVETFGSGAAFFD